MNYMNQKSDHNNYNSKEETKMRKGMKKFIVMLFAVMLFVLNAMPVMAAGKEIPITKVNFPKTITLKVGESKTFAVTTGPVNTTYKTNIQWGYQTNSKFSVKVNGYGSYWNQKSSETLTGIKVGKGYLNIRVKVYDSNNTFIRNYDLRTVVNVVDNNASNTGDNTSVKVPLSKISLNKTSASVTEGSTFNLTVSYSPTNTTDSKSVTWTSSNSSVATVSGGKVTAKKAGSATITAKVGSKTATCKVTVKAPLKSISLNKSSASVTVGQSFNLSVKYNPTNTTDSKSVIWTSSNTSVATVSGGKVTAKKAGTATITAKVGSKTAACKVTVKAAPSGSTADTGSYKNVSDAYSILNTFRTTKANQWYWNSDNTAKVTTYGLKELKRDTTLENVAKLRAKEAWTMYYEKGLLTHDRPDGSRCFTAYPAGLTYKGENLAWGHANSSIVILDPAGGWAETNAKYSGQGHRRNMLNSRFTKVGIACYEKDGKTCWAMCLGG